MDGPYIRLEESGEVQQLNTDVTTVGRGEGTDIRLSDPSVSQLHAELVRRGPYVYVADSGLSRNGTRVNGRPVARRVLEDGDVVSFGTARGKIGGLGYEDLSPEAELRRSSAPELTRRELDVLTALCSPCCPRRPSCRPRPRVRSPRTSWSPRRQSNSTCSASTRSSGYRKERTAAPGWPTRSWRWD